MARYQHYLVILYSSHKNNIIDSYFHFPYVINYVWRENYRHETVANLPKKEQSDENSMGSRFRVQTSLSGNLGDVILFS